ncbi:MAG: sigma-70 family RNA polymerase sigma factor [Pseudomonadota bacterium]
MTFPSDVALIRALLSGSERAFREFFDEYYDRVYRFVLMRVDGDHAATEDITQSALSKALRKLSRFKGEARLFSWLCAIARNETVDWLRRQGRYKTHIVFVDDDPEVASMVDAVSVARETGPEAQASRQQRLERIHAALDRLPRRYGDALEWKYIEGLSIREIADRLELSGEATQSTLARARRAFAEIYSTLSAGSPAALVRESDS